MTTKKLSKYRSLQLRDNLTLHQTYMSLTRTMLAFCRTALGLLASGAGLVILQQSFPALLVLGYILIVLSAVIMVYGIVYCLRIKRQVRELEESADQVIDESD